MSANEIRKIEQEPKHQYSLDELKSIIRQAMAEHREFVEREIKPRDDERECHLATWDDVLSYVQRLDLDPKPQFPVKNELLWDALDDMEMASMLVRSGAKLCAKRPGDKSGSSFLHILSSSSDPRKHELAVLMIEHGADLNDHDAEGNTALRVAVKNEAFSVIEAILKKTVFPHSLCKEYKNSIALAMRSPNVAKLLDLFFRYRKLDIVDYCLSIPWYMPEDHLAIVVKTLLQQLSDQTNKSEVFYLWHCVMSENLKLAKLLLSSITYPYEKLTSLQVLLSYYFIKDKPAILVVLIRSNINCCVNNEKQYPLHIVCKYNGHKTARLLLQLGADVNVIDLSGKTPFSTRFKVSRLDEVTKLMIKQFAYLGSKRTAVNKKDLSIIQNEPGLQRFYESCVEELKKMKTIDVTDRISFHCVFSKSIYELSLLLINPDILKQLRTRLVELKPDVFPIYKNDMIIQFEIASKMRNIVVSRERELEEVFSDFLPCIVLRKIVIYSLDLINFEKECHLSRFE